MFARLLALSVAPLAAPASVCSGTPPSPAFATPAAFHATVAGQNHIDLAWEQRATAPGGSFLEFRLNEEPDFSLLALLAADVTAFRHPDVARHTRFTYRLRPFFGHTSAIVEITTGAEPPAGLFRQETDGPLPAASATPLALRSPGLALRHPDTFTAAAPVRPAVSRNSTTTVDLRWSDRARDEDGFLVELSVGADGPWQFCALLPPDTESFRKTRLPPHTLCRFRVRAFFHGGSSLVASVTTPAEFRPPSASPEATAAGLGQPPRRGSR